MNYTKHQIKRVRNLNDKYFEVVFDKRNLKFIPGDAVVLYNGPDIPIFIASGMQEAWVRLILDRDLFPSFDMEATSIRLESKVLGLIPKLISEEAPNFLITTAGVSPFFSYVSTFPKMYLEKKCTICYLGEDKVQESWIRAFHNLVIDPSKLRNVSNLYAIGDIDVLEGEASKILRKCKNTILL